VGALLSQSRIEMRGARDRELDAFFFLKCRWVGDAVRSHRATCAGTDGASAQVESACGALEPHTSWHSTSRAAPSAAPSRSRPSRTPHGTRGESEAPCGSSSTDSELESHANASRVCAMHSAEYARTIMMEGAGCPRGPRPRYQPEAACGAPTRGLCGLSPPGTVDS
jgi:hypothetical protein